MPKSLRAVVALVLLAGVVLYASTVVGRYRTNSAVEAAQKPSGTTSTPTKPSTTKPATPPATSKGEGEQPAEDKKTVGTGETVVIKVDGLNFRVDPDKDAKVIRGLDAGEKLALLERKDGWFYAEDAEGQKGWLYGSEQYSTLEEQ